MGIRADDLSGHTERNETECRSFLLLPSHLQAISYWLNVKYPMQAPANNTASSAGACNLKKSTHMHAQTHCQAANCRCHNCVYIDRDLGVRQVMSLESKRDSLHHLYHRIFLFALPYFPPFLPSLPLPLKCQYHFPLFLPESAHHSLHHLIAFFICQSSHPHLLSISHNCHSLPLSNTLKSLNRP